MAFGDPPCCARREPKLCRRARIQLRELERWRRGLVPCAVVSIIINGVTDRPLIVDGTGIELGFLATLVGFALCAWAGTTQVKIERLEWP